MVSSLVCAGDVVWIWPGHFLECPETAVPGAGWHVGPPQCLDCSAHPFPEASKALKLTADALCQVAALETWRDFRLEISRPLWKA